MSEEINFALLRKNMVENQLRPNGICDAILLDIMGQVKREDFLSSASSPSSSPSVGSSLSPSVGSSLSPLSSPYSNSSFGLGNPDLRKSDLRSIAYIDASLPLESAKPHSCRFLLSPMIFAKLLMLANVKETDLVLDVASNNLYGASIIAHMASLVVALEDDELLYKQAEQNLKSQSINNIVLVKGNPALGVASKAPFDVIFLEGAIDDAPEVLLSQLAESGRLVALTRQTSSNRYCATRWTKQNNRLCIDKNFSALAPLLPQFKREDVFAL